MKTILPKEINGLPRRIQIDQHSSIEMLIYTAMFFVEDAGCNPLLTDAAVLLAQAKEKIADYLEEIK